MKNVLDRLADEKSKLNFCNILFARLTEDDSYYFAINDWCVNQYFDLDILPLNNDEVFADCGAFIGDSAIIFIKTMERLGLNYRAIYSFDPLETNIMAAKRNLRTYQNISLINAGVSDKVSTIGLKKEGISTSYLSESESDEEVQTVTLDSAISEKITLLKMDIEGFEQQALEGARQHIISDVPKLAICIYHKPDDLFEIPELIDEMHPGYKMYIRHYHRTSSESVLYCV